jgi:hypothetical protein
MLESSGKSVRNKNFRCGGNPGISFSLQYEIVKTVFFDKFDIDKAANKEAGGGKGWGNV